MPSFLVIHEGFSRHCFAFPVWRLRPRCWSPVAALTIPFAVELIDPPAVVTTLTAAQIDATTAASGLQALSGKAKCDVKVVALNYRTPGAKEAR